MSRLFFTGDTHNSLQINRISFKNWSLSRDLNKDDILCVLGDFGFPWDGGKSDQYWLDWCEDRPFSIVFVDGNHVNHPLLNTYPIEKWNGGKTHVLRPHIHHLMRGEIFTINNQSFFSMGGARSVDKIYRKEGKTWWSEEMPSWNEMDYAANNLRKNNFKVDYILTHCAPNYIVDKLFPYENQHDDITNFLDKFVRMTTEFKCWFMGHYHINRNYDNKYTILYDNIIELFPEDV